MLFLFPHWKIKLSCPWVFKAVRDIRNGTGLQALLDVSGCSDGLINSSKIAFNIAPRINAAGRLDLATTVVGLLNCKSQTKHVKSLEK